MVTIKIFVCVETLSIMFLKSVKLPSTFLYHKTFNLFEDILFFILIFLKIF